MSGHWQTKHVLPYHVYYTERNNGVLSEHGSSKFQCQFHPSLLRGESFHSQNTHVTFPWSNCPKLDRQQAINIPYSFTKVYLPSCLSDMVWTREKYYTTRRRHNHATISGWTNPDRETIRSMYATESGYIVRLSYFPRLLLCLLSFDGHIRC